MKRPFLFTALVISILMISLHSRADDATTKPATQPVSTPAPLPADSELARMLQSSNAPGPIAPEPNPPAVDATSGMAAVKPKAPTNTLTPEGIYVLNRVARLGKMDNGFRELVYQSDGEAMQDPPMRILPNQTLKSMEDQAKLSNDPVAFRVSGLITVYKDHNYILIEKAVIEARK